MIARRAGERAGVGRPGGERERLVIVPVEFRLLAGSEFSDAVPNWLRGDLDAHKKGVGGIAQVFVAMHIPPAGLGETTWVEGQNAQDFDDGSRRLLELLREYSWTSRRTPARP